MGGALSEGGRLVLVRHCEEVLGLSRWPRLTDLHLWQESEGQRPLTHRGLRRAAGLAPRIAELEPDALFVSPHVRAAETAAPIAERTGLEPETWLELAEVSYGHLAGFEPRLTRGWRKAFTRIPAPRALWPPLMRGLWLLGWTTGSFSPGLLQRQSHELRERFEEMVPARTAVVVAHGVVLLYLHAALLGEESFFALRRHHRLQTGEFAVLDFDGETWRETRRERGALAPAAPSPTE